MISELGHIEGLGQKAYMRPAGSLRAAEHMDLVNALDRDADGSPTSAAATMRCGIFLVSITLCDGQGTRTFDHDEGRQALGELTPDDLTILIEEAQAVNGAGEEAKKN